MKSTNHSRVPAGRGLVAGALLCVWSLIAFASRANAQGAPSPQPPSYWFSGTRLNIDRPQERGGAIAIPQSDGALARLLDKLGATLAYQTGSRVVIVTTADRRTITFTVGDERYSVDGTNVTGPFAPYVVGDAVYLPFLELVRALGIVPVRDGSDTVLEPQLAALDVRTSGKTTTVVLRGAGPLTYERIPGGSPSRLTVRLPGVGSSLERVRTIANAALGAVTITSDGSPRKPTTTVSFDLPTGSVAALAPAAGPNIVAIAFAPAGTTLPGPPLPATGPIASTIPKAAPLGPTPTSAPTPTALGLPVANVVGFSADSTSAGTTVAVRIDGSVTYEWHRLGDNRYYVDFKPATLAIEPQERELASESVDSVRVKGFTGPNDHLPTVRVALSLTGPHVVDLVAAGAGMTIVVDRDSDTSPVHGGVGALADGQLVAAVPLPPPTAEASPDAETTPEPWKFAPPIKTTPGKLIVIDPGHGGSDSGAISSINGLVEKDLNLTVSKLLRTALIARGWTVKLTRETDVDVYAPNDSARDELQARDDIANGAGAALLISMHTNSFTSTGLSGTTTYYYTDASYPLARAIHARLASALPTKDDGIRKENFYVIHHVKMPAVLVETAFLSNPGDAARLASPEFLRTIAQSIADGVGDYQNSRPVTDTNATSSISVAEPNASDR